MLRSKNLKKILEQVLTKDISICAVFNEDGVVLAHASTPTSPNSLSKRESHQLLHSGVAAGSADPSRPRHVCDAQYDNDILQSDYGSMSSLGNFQSPASQTQSQYPLYTNNKQAFGTEPIQGKQLGTVHTSGTMPLVPEPGTHVSPTSAYSPGRHARQNEDNESGTGNSYLSSSADDLIGNPPNLTMRERLEDDLAIAANIWQSYEGVSGLIERKDRDMDEAAGDGNSEVHDTSLGNSLNMIIIECEYGKAVVTRLGSYRLFILSKASTPLGLLRLKSTSLSQCLEECLYLGRYT